ncbi:MAG: TonB-dependent receptor [Gammaproteobacteria bacterium]|nr:TonB-dependent receptor [Gammaproteobacteria bacterium]
MRTVVQIVSALSIVSLSSFAYAEDTEDEPLTPIVEEKKDQIEEVTVLGSRLNADLIGLESIDLSDQTPQTLTSAMQSLTSMAVSQSGNVGSLTQIRVRGAEADHVKVLMDGVPLGNPSTVNLNLSVVAPTGVSRIDALNGPRSAVWGSDALAGIVNLSTNPTPSNRLYVDRGSNQAWFLGTNLGASVAGVPLALHYSTLGTDGTNVSYEGDERDGFRQDSMHASYQKVGTNFQASGFLRTTRSSSEYDPIPRDGDRRLDLSDQILAQRLSWQPRVDFQLSANGSITRSVLRNFSEGNETNSSDGDLTRLSLEGSFSLTPSQEMSVLIDHTAEDFEQRGSPSFFGDPNYVELMAATGLAGEYLVSSDRFQWHASLRREQNSEFGDSTAWQTSVLLRSDAFRWSYSLGVGIKNPTFIERFGFTPDTFLGNPDIQPERALQHQVAVQYEPEGHSLKIALYSSALEDEINGFSFNAETNQFTAANLESESRRRGGEIRYSRTFDNLKIETNYAYVKSEEDKELEIRRPKHLANLGIHYTFSDRMRSRSTIHYVGEQLDRDFSTFPATVVTLNDHVLATVALEYDITSKLMLHGMVDNLLDTEYEHVYGFRTPGRTFNVGMRAAF